MTILTMDNTQTPSNSVDLTKIQKELLQLEEEKSLLAQKEKELIAKKQSLLNDLALSIGHRIISDLDISNIEQFNNWYADKHMGQQMQSPSVQPNERTIIPLPAKIKTQYIDEHEKIKSEISEKRKIVQDWLKRHNINQIDLSRKMKHNKSFVGQALSNSKSNQKNPNKQLNSLNKIIKFINAQEKKEQNKIAKMLETTSNEKTHNTHDAIAAKDTPQQIDYANKVNYWLKSNEQIVSKQQLARALNMPLSQLNDVLNRGLQHKAKIIYDYIEKEFKSQLSFIDSIERIIKKNPDSKIAISIIRQDIIEYYEGADDDVTTESYLDLKYTTNEYNAKLLDFQTAKTFYVNFIKENPDIPIDLTIIDEQSQLQRYSQAYTL